MTDETKPAARIASDRRVGSFVLLEKLGAGGLGEVWKARDHRLNRVVALKFILSGQKQSTYDLAHEARAASALNHPNIVTILEIGESDSGTYIAMEFVEGETLRGRMRQARVPFDTAIDIVTQVARGLAAAHRNGIVHRDVKPENVMIRMDGYVKLVDFGLAKVLPWNDEVTNQGSMEGTETGQIVGTVSYMSPEQARGQHVDASSDVFSFGIVFYELLTGEHPFRADNPLDTLQRIVSAEPVSIRTRCPEVRHEVHEIVDRCLKKDKSERFPSGIDLETELRRLQGLPARPAEPAKSGNRGKLLVAAFSLAILLGILVVAMNPFSRPGPTSTSIHSVAVMNFRITPGDSQASTFALSLSEDLGGALAKEGFQVASRSSVLGLDAQSNARNVGSQLAVDTVLEGSITSANNSFRVHAELVASQTGFQIWSETFNSDNADIFKSELSAAGEIAARLKEAEARGQLNAPKR